MLLPAPLDVLEATLGPAARVVSLEGARVVRTTGRPDHARGNAVHRSAALTARTAPAAVADLEQRFPTGQSRLVAPLDGPRVPEVFGYVPAILQVLRHTGAAAPTRNDLELAVPADERAWHGLTVLHRHAAAPGEDRARGAADERLRWWVEGLRELSQQGRARVLLATRFGTPVAAGVLHWSPGTTVDDGHAGLAVVADVVVHPAHRRLGIGRAIVTQLVAAHRADFPKAAVHGVWEHPGSERPTASPRGWTVDEVLAVLRRGDGGPDEGRR